MITNKLFFLAKKWRRDPCSSMPTLELDNIKTTEYEILIICNTIVYTQVATKTRETDGFYVTYI